MFLTNFRLNAELQVKVADFGLSRDIYTKEYYSSEDRKTKLPVKWMAIESLTKAIYTTKSDVVSDALLFPINLTLNHTYCWYHNALRTK